MFESETPQPEMLPTRTDTADVTDTPREVQQPECDMHSNGVGGDAKPPTY